jgi:hypothetical protein
MTVGARPFTTEAAGATLKEAFAQAITDAAYEYGHGGYTGTIAEKNPWDELVPLAHRPMEPDDAHRLADELLRDDDPRISDKHGPTGAIPLKTEGGETPMWLLVGWAAC